MEQKIKYCCVCGYDLSKENECVERYVLCLCCGFHYGFDDIGEMEPFYNFRTTWLKKNKDNQHLLTLGIHSKFDLLKQLENIKLIDLANYYLPHFNDNNLLIRQIEDFEW